MRRSFLLVFALIAVTLAGPTSSAGAAGSSFTLFGSGFGHGIGMSQWGAYGMASAGWNHADILTHFYSGTKIVDTPPLPPKIRVGLTLDEGSIHLTASHGSLRLWTGTPLTGTPVASIPQGETWTVSPSRSGTYKVRDAAGSLVGRHWGSTTEDLFVTYWDARARASMQEADRSGSGTTYGRGYLEFNTYLCSTRCRERLILKIPFEQYLLGIGEVSSSWPRQALEAQVVASRTYAAYDVRNYGLRSGCNCDVEDGGNDQTYLGWSQESGTDGDRWFAAVRATRSEVVTYKGAIIQAFFAASDGGYSENVEDAWHGGDPRYAIPYLRGVCDVGENTPADPWVSWSYSFSAADVAARLTPYTGSIGTITGFDSDVRGVSGRIVTVRVVGASGKAVVTGGELRAALALPDDRVWFDRDKNILGAIRTAYDDLDCRPGSPTTATLVLPDGSRQRFEHGGIYVNTTAGITVWVRGSIYDEYRAVGDASGVLGLPVDDVVSLPPGSAAGCSGCKQVDFEGGRMYVNPSVGTHAIWGPALSAYLAEGGPGGHLGYPTDRVVTASDASTSITFEHGSISCTAGGVCQVG